ncbi:urease accessory protein UreF [sulfur-oxidizing endosymbiont of Gigantopelta aegis]|uniref:urease accessory protein UreF n=1 Tax=sulfur-oxidizing endosymbiont of Gigantopelta aegis TaxID=2794934 RepID=UPI001FE60E59|nr:urease accessory protein UreF [sulfur-oxidizing endosymbiont of Gigantopelta aegis]
MPISLTMSEQEAVDPYALVRLWQLISPSLPIGAYAYSQGLETAIEKAWVSNEAEANKWIQGILSDSLATLDAPVLVRLYQAWQAQDFQKLEQWNQFLLASRESSELYLEDQQMGRALWRLLNDILPTSNAEQANIEQYRTLIGQLETPTYALVFSLACVVWRIPLPEAIRGFLWSWCENQVAASIKLIPLGQTAGQRILSGLIAKINDSVVNAMSLCDEEIGTLAPGFSIACAQHEVQYSRLFRS